MSHDIWAVIHDEERGTQALPHTRRRTMALLANRQTWEGALELWKLADDRRIAGLAPEVDYLVVRDSDDEPWQRRYPQVRAGRLTALLARPGRLVRVRIYANDYIGTVVKATTKSADVRFNTSSGPRVRPFPILPADRFARGVQA